MMAQHVWSVLCEKLLTEDDSGVISLITVMDKIMVNNTLEEVEKEMGEATGFAFPMRLITYCVRSDYSKPEVFMLRFEWVAPKGDSIMAHEFSATLEEATGARVKIRVPGVPWRGPGLYWLCVDIKDDVSDWTNVARLPLEVEVGVGQPLASHKVT